jgi:hypothetical protein
MTPLKSGARRLEGGTNGFKGVVTHSQATQFWASRLGDRLTDHHRGLISPAYRGGREWADEIKLAEGEVAILSSYGDEYNFACWIVGTPEQVIEHLLGRGFDKAAERVRAAA